MSRAPIPTGAFALRAALWLLLGSWIGAWLCFGLVIAPTAFRVLPSLAVAGQLIGPVLDALHWYGALAGALLAVLAWRLDRGPGLVLLSLAASALCALSQLVITPRIEGIRPLAFGPQGSAEIAAQFHHLHQLSVLIFCVVGLTTLILLAGHVSADLRSKEGDPP
jgi:hypothetical protein